MLIQGVTTCKEIFTLPSVFVIIPTCYPWRCHFDTLAFQLRLILHVLFKCRRIRDELANQNAETTNLTNKLDRVSIVLLSEDNVCFQLLFEQ